MLVIVKFVQKRHIYRGIPHHRATPAHVPFAARSSLMISATLAGDGLSRGAADFRSHGASAAGAGAGVLGGPRKKAASDTGDAAEALPDVSSCDALHVLAARLPPPDDAQVPLVARVRKALAEARTAKRSSHAASDDLEGLVL